MSDDTILLVIIIFLTAIALFIAWKLLQFAFLGAAFLFAAAAAQGFIGLAAYLAVWIFLFPFMLAICIFFGIGIKSEEKQERAQLKEQASRKALARKLRKERGYDD